MDPTPLRAFRIELAEQAVILEGEDGSCIRVEAAHAVLLQQIVALFGSPPPVAPSPAAPASPTKQQDTVTLTGRLKSTPKEGRPDGHGNPTAWARFAARDPEGDQVRVYSTTFHRRCAQIALGLSRDDQLTVIGYVRPSSQEGRLDGLSVFAVPNYPGKAERGEE
jgi:hypothetical protein